MFEGSFNRLTLNRSVSLEAYFFVSKRRKYLPSLWGGDLNLGKNNLTCTDLETGRSVLLRVTHQDVFLY